MVVEVRQATQKDLMFIESFFEKSDPHKYQYPARWEWLNIRNPFIKKDFGLPYWLAVKNDQIIGHVGVMVVPVKICEHTIIGSWGVDLLIVSNARGMGIGKKMLKIIHSINPLFMALEITDLNRAINKKMGIQNGPFVSLLYLTKYILAVPLIKDIDISLRKRVGYKWWKVAKKIDRLGLSKAFCWGISKAIQFRQRKVKFPRQQTNFTFEPISHFDQKADELWESIRLRYQLAVERTSAYLNWKYFDQPYMHHQCFYIKQGDTVQGVLVFRQGEIPEPPIGVISECYLRDPTIEKYVSVIQKAVIQLMTQGAVGIWAGTSETEFEMALKEQGFLKIRQKPMLLNVVDGLNQDESNLRPALFGKGDHDWDQFLRLRQPTLQQFVRLVDFRK
jgi:hypothetical protein